MPAKDIYHNTVKIALQKNGWIITHDPFPLKIGKKRLSADLGADTPLKYRAIIKSVLQGHANYRAAFPDGYTSQALFDDERGQYLVLDIGWNGDNYLHTTPIHLSLINNKIWIQCDDTEEGVSTDLVEAGVPKENIVLGFRHPKIRQHTGFAVA